MTARLNHLAQQSRAITFDLVVEAVCSFDGVKIGRSGCAHSDGGHSEGVMFVTGKQEEEITEQPEITEQTETF